MPGRPPHGTYDEERDHVLITLHAQIHILKDNYPGNRRMTINSLGLLLNRVRGLRMAGQRHHRRNNAAWTDKCNTLYSKLVGWRDELIHDPNCTHLVANNIEATMILLDFVVSDEIQYRISLHDVNELPRRGRSGAPSPELLNGKGFGTIDDLSLQ